MLDEDENLSENDNDVPIPQGQKNEIEKPVRTAGPAP
jgi:hypothetical protein